MDAALEDILSDWARPSFHLESDTVVVADGQDLVAYAVEFHQRAFVHVHPRARGRGIGGALLAWTEERARAHGEQFVGQTLSENETAACTSSSTRGRGLDHQLAVARAHRGRGLATWLREQPSRSSGGAGCAPPA